MRKLSRFLLSKTFLLGVLIACQFGFLAALLLLFRRAGSITYLILTVISALIIIAVIERDNTNPAYKIMWLLIVVALPVTGPLFYLWWGRQSNTLKSARSLNAIEAEASNALVSVPETLQALNQQYPEFARSAHYLVNYSSAPVYDHTACEYFSIGELFLPRFLEMLKTARKSIFMEYFIIEDGVMWSPILDILKEKAAAGVDVRVMYDGFGSMFTLPDDYPEYLAQFGIQCKPFNPLHFSLHVSDYKMLNHRDHRKIAVIDDNIGFIGGLNLADEYINRKVRCGIWKDSALMMRGAGVYSLSVSFLKMWNYVSGTYTDYAEHRPSVSCASDGFVQPFCDTPLNDENVAESAYLNVIRRARRYVYITTPYLIIDHEMQTALCLAAKSGVDVRIMTPGIPDKHFVYFVTQSYYHTLLKAGVRIYEYSPGFIHAKMFVSDDTEAIVGTSNLDYRSLYLHFENCCSFYGGPVVDKVYEDITQTFSVCHEVTLAESEHVPLPKWLAQVFLRIFSPLL